MAELTFLVDNSPSGHLPELEAEHGFSLYIRFHNKNILCDTGASGCFAGNAEKIGISLKDLSFAFMSHGHADHTGGLAQLLELSGTDIYISKYAEDRHFISLRHEKPKDISPDFRLFMEYRDRFRFVSTSTWLSEDIAAVYNISDRYAKPYGNSYLEADCGAGGRQDDFIHEMALVLKRNSGIIIISPCSHGGAGNIMDSCRRFTGERRVKAYIGGLHFVDSPYTEEETERFLKEMQETAPETVFYTGHCTGDKAKARLSGNPRIKFFHTGDRLVI